MRIVILGAGVQGTLYGIRLARAGHNVTLIAHGERAVDLRTKGAIVQNAITGHRDAMHLTVVESLAPDTRADLCFVFVRREQIEEVLPDLRAAHAVERFVFMINHANGSGNLFAALGRKRVVLGFPSAAGCIQNGVDLYVDVTEQKTTIEYSAPDIGAILRSAGFRVELVLDMDSWLKRHAVFVTAVAGALYLKSCDVHRLAADKTLVRGLILAVREGWSALDRQGVAAPPLALRMIFTWVPLPFAVIYWRRLFASPKGEFYFARHTRHANREMAALAGDVRALVLDEESPNLRLLHDAIAVASSGGDSRGQTLMSVV